MESRPLRLDKTDHFIVCLISLFFMTMGLFVEFVGKGHGNNNEGVAGVAWAGVRLMALKFLSASGGGRTSDAIKCLNYASWFEQQKKIYPPWN